MEITGKAEDIVTDQCCIRVLQLPAITDPLILQSLKENVVEQRKNRRKKILKDINQLRKNVYILTHLEPVKTDVDKVFGHYIYTAMPKDYKKKFLTAISKEKCPKARFYDITDDDKKLEAEISSGMLNVRYLQRLVAMNVLDEFGFTDDMRIPIILDYNLNIKDKPEKPKADTIDTATKGNIMHEDTWQNYVDSLRGTPPIGQDLSTIGAALKGALKGALDERLDNLNLKKSFDERKLWGEGKNGQILFGSGKTTYALEGNSFKPIEVLESSIKSSMDLDDKEKDAIQHFVSKIQQKLRTF